MDSGWIVKSPSDPIDAIPWFSREKFPDSLLQLDDSLTDFFRDLGGYDFRDEVNVDVLGHIFEKSIGELQRLRSTGLFEEGAGAGHAATVTAMKKSAERKRSGIYYTPPEFTRFLVRETVSVLIAQRREAIRRAHGLSQDDLMSGPDTPALVAFWRGCWDDLRAVKVCDPACGSGAFLIQAYEVFEEEYVRIADHCRALEGAAADALLDEIPDRILNDNLHGVDLSEQAVEITQLALWLRSARRGKTLADLSKNVVCGNRVVSYAT
jgi:hypothetical protein